MRTYDHDLELSSLIIELEQEFGVDRLKTEREMRSLDMPLGTLPREHPRFAVPLGGTRGQLQLTPVGYPRLHFPDAAIQEPGAETVLAVELERTAKGRRRLRGILSAYVAARHIERVRYIVSNERVLQLVRTEIADLRASAMIEVTRLAPTSHPAEVA